MKPKLVEIPLGFATLPINAYGFMLMIAFLLGVVLCSRRARKIGVSADFVVDMTIWVMISSILGSRIGYIVQFHQQFDLRIFDLTDGGFSIIGGIIGWLTPLWFYLRRRKTHPPATEVRREWLSLKELGVLIPLCVASAAIVARGVHLVAHREAYDWGVLQVWEGGLAFYGGVILASGVGMYFARRQNLPMLRVADLVMPFVALGYGITRMGCFLNGCCYGTTVEKGFPLAVQFPRLVDPEGRLIGSPAYLDHFEKGWVTGMMESSLPVQPTQLYSVVWGVVLFFVLSAIWKRRKREGEVLAWFGILYSVERFFLEYWRADNQRTAAGAPVDTGLTIWQWVSLGLFVSAWLLMAWVRKVQPRLGEDGRGEPVAAVKGADDSGGAAGPGA